MIEVKNLTKKYGDHVAVKNLSFKVEKGKIYGFLGPNGAGKSTTMNIITGCLAATEGHVLIDGHDIYEEPLEAKKHIGYLPELPPVYPDMTPSEYLRFVAEAKGLNRAEAAEQLEYVMNATGIKKYSSRLIKNLSKGYKQRVGIAQAMLGNPDIIILDEPTVGLDPKQIIEIRSLIKRLGENHTIILSSHILPEVAAVCDYVMIIAHGNLVASDTLENLSNYLTGDREIAMKIKGAEGVVRMALNELDGIIEYDISDSDEDAVLEVKIKSDRDRDIREALWSKFASLGIPVLNMVSETITLEDVFLRLTREPDEEDRTGLKLNENFVTEIEVEENDEDGVEVSVPDASDEDDDEEDDDDEDEPAPAPVSADKTKKQESGEYRPLFR